ncbi:MAG TPA: SMP-30/gluconolactonase/LRE family protein [Polyangiaceae bacterium]|nr:SMP-30/gluconolactonase/LRE family protein [Polyangiaceae bacterium]
MKPSLACVCLLSLGVACSAGGGGTSDSRGASGASNSAGAATNAGGNSATGGTATSGGSAGTASATAGASNGGSAGSSNGGASGAGNSAGAGGAAGTSATGFKCPASPGTFTLPTGKAEHIPGTTPVDSFNMNAGFTNVEGPVWIGDSLYFSEMLGGSLPPSRILKLTPPGNTVSVAVADSGSNGMAVDSNGNLIAAVHKDGSISQVTLPSGPVTPIVSMYMGNRFISPNDLAVRSDGTIYFSDPNYQNSTNPPPQTAQRLYRVTPAPARTVSVIADAPMMPNGVTLSPDESTLYVDGTTGLMKFAVMTDGSLGPASMFVMNYSGDGMVVDCAGDLYVAGGSSNVTVYSAAGATLGTITTDNGGTSTNVAFGGADHKTLYITAQGNDGQRGVFSIVMPIAGFPY